MDQLLTTKEVQNALKIDRLTIYRMLKDGRLTGIKIGSQWRFSRQEVEALLSGSRPSQLPPASHAQSTAPAPVAASSPEAPLPGNALPIHCVQLIQDVFAEIADVGSVTAAPDGYPLTEFSNSCAFCNMILTSEEGRQGCIASWRKLANQTSERPEFATCHAGLQYARGRIEIDGELAALLIAGQFYTGQPDSQEEAERIYALARKYGLDEAKLLEAARDLKVIDERRRSQLGRWLEKVSHTFEDIGTERARLMDRLRRIAAMSMLEAELSE